MTSLRGYVAMAWVERVAFAPGIAAEIVLLQRENGPLFATGPLGA